MKTLFPFLLSATLLTACNSSTKTQETIVTGTDTIVPVATPQQTCGDATSDAKIAQALSMEVLADMTREEAEQWKHAKERPESGLTEFQLDTTYNAHCILSVTAMMEWMAAYPSFWNRYVNMDKSTGNPLLAKNVFDNEKLTQLAAECNGKLQDNIVDARAEVEQGDLEFFEQMISEKGSFTEEDLNTFYLTDTSIIFEYQFSFPHVALALQPSGSIAFTKAEIKQYIDISGKLASWIQY